MNWYRRHRPNVHWYLWSFLLILNTMMAALCSWVSINQDKVSMKFEIIFFTAGMLACYMLTRYWQHWINNPKDYETLQQERIRRFVRRVGRTRRTRTDKAKKKEEESKK